MAKTQETLAKIGETQIQTVAKREEIKRDNLSEVNKILNKGA